MKTTIFQNPQRPGKAWFCRFASSLLACAAAVLTAGSAQAQNLVANGDFSANASSFVAGEGWIAGVGAPYASNPGTVQDWLCDSYPAASLAINGPATGLTNKFIQGPITRPSYNFVWMQWMTQNIYQMLPLNPSTTYQVDLDAAGQSGSAGGKFQANFRDGFTVVCSSGDQVVSKNGFMHYTFTFTTPAVLSNPNIDLLISGTVASDGVNFANISVLATNPVVVVAATNLIANGDFTANAAAFTTPNGALGAPNPTTITNWTAGAGLIGLNGPATTAGTAYGPATPGANNFAFIVWGSASSSLSQTLTSDYVPNTRYQLDFDAAPFRWSPSLAFRVQIADSSATHFTTQVGGNDLNISSSNTFVHYTYTFTAPATFTGSSVISLINEDAVTSGGGMNFANVFLKKLSAAAPNIIDNGNFTANAAAFTTPNGALGAPNATTITSWTAGGGAIGLNGPATTAGTAYGPATPGSYNFAFIAWGGAASTLSQTLSGSYTPNTQYELSFDAANFRWAPSLAFRVSIADNTQTHATTKVGSVDLDSTPLNSFTHFTYTFTSPATFNGPCVIQLLNNDAVTSSAGVDFANISLQEKVVIKPTMVMTKSGSNLQFNWSNGVLLEATSLAGPWTTNSTTSPSLAIPVGHQKFFRAMAQ